MKIDRNGSRPSTIGVSDYFSGSVRVEPVFQVGDPMCQSASPQRALDEGPIVASKLGACSS